ncbi:DMT family transporter [Nitratireductor sp. ZSWI3]|uniref:DMT family transporter n=1 Tax=Nitratireductor sp. ZSWI3 TaxID=2966359 RepID=UPI00214F66CC|nr:DMT family transporter [Nitratireductor sp. ZSWI3]MCR4267631.1 DMT family transporter [Nitratireductor sp. ZSWI3]
MSIAIPGADGRRDAIDAFAALMMIGLTLSWGLNQVAIKIANTGYSPMFLMFLRSAVATLLVFLWCRYRRIALFEKDGTLLPGLLAGVLFGLEFLLIFFGLDYTSAARGALMLNTMPFWVLIGGHFLLGEKMSSVKFGGLVMAFLGVALVFSDGLSLPGPEALLGDVLCLFAGLLWAATIIVIKQSKLTEASAEKTLIYQLAVSTVLPLPFLPFTGPLLRDVTFLATGAFLFHAVFVVAFTYVLWFWLMRRYPASGLSSFAFLTPVFGVLCGGIVLGEPLTAKILLALALIAAGLVVVNRPRRRIVPA